MMNLVSVNEMQAIEKEANEKGHSYADMMECAGHGLGVWVDEAYGETELRTVLGLVGSGNNGGDTLVALDYLQEQGWYAYGYLVKPRASDDPLVTRFLGKGGILLNASDDLDFNSLEEHLQQSSVLLDGILGTGIKLPLKPEISRVLNWVRQFIFSKEPLTNPLCDVKVVCHPHIIAVDCPSGVDSDTGEAAPECLPAEVTVCMSAVKRGLVTFPAFSLVGRLVTVDIGLPDGLPAVARITRSVVDRDQVRAILPVREMTAHKGTFGTVMAVAGSINFTGAAFLSGQAAYRIGAGLVNMAVAEPLYYVLAGLFPEATWLLLPNDNGVISSRAAEMVRGHLDRVTALLLGPGWGLENETQAFLTHLLMAESAVSQRGAGFVYPTANISTKAKPAPLPPLVIDADGLKLLSKIPHWETFIPPLTVLTPHPGEMSVLTGLPVDQIQASRLETAENYAHQWGHVVVLKGALTIIAEPEGKTAIIPVATSALARAGTGDVLAGLITGLRGQGVGAFEAALAGAWIHANAGLLSAEKMGNTASVLAGDVLNCVPEVITQLFD